MLAIAEAEKSSHVQQMLLWALLPMTFSDNVEERRRYDVDKSICHPIVQTMPSSVNLLRAWETSKTGDQILISDVTMLKVPQDRDLHGEYTCHLIIRYLRQV